ncbi:IQ domain-containing protein C [Hypanus sabinus]|uniref:IQ domain-containing protein C n=1 Tax=Hypanus sabinus TaxID=79690 RepID=UPI0028C4038C|nr:IQ domain-containing protein C [Hypanus sabinus]
MSITSASRRRLVYSTMRHFLRSFKMAAAELRGVCTIQAHVRGYLVRKKFRSLRQDYECIVREIEGVTDMLEWDGKELPRPRFRNQVSGTEGVHNILQSKTSETFCPKAEESTDHPLLENDEPVKDSCESTNPSSRQSTPRQLDAPNTLNVDTSSHEHVPHIESTVPFSETEQTFCASGDERKGSDNSSTVMSACNRAVLENISKGNFIGPLCKLQRKEMPTSFQELQNYRSSLAMELLWLQQAIVSRKNYLILKQKLGAPELATASEL